MVLRDSTVNTSIQRFDSVVFNQTAPVSTWRLFVLDSHYILPGESFVLWMSMILT